MGIKRDLKDTMRDTKNFFKGYSRIQVKLRQATSVDPWGPATIQMEEIARATHSPTLLGDLIYVFDRRLNDHGKYWRHVYKSLVTMEYCIVCGSDAFVRYAKDTIYVIKTLKEFQYIDDKGRDQGAMIRQKSREIVALLQNEAALAEARRTKTIPRTTTTTINDRSNSISPIDHRSSSSHPQNRSNNTYEDDQQLQRAIEESKRTAVEEAKRRASSDDAFFHNMHSSSTHRSSSYDRNGTQNSTNLTITQDHQPRIILTQVPHTMTVKKSIQESTNNHAIITTENFDLVNDDPFSQINMNQHESSSYTNDMEEDPFANAEEIDKDLDPFANAEEVSMTRPTMESNTKRNQNGQPTLNIPRPKNPLERARSDVDNIGAKPVKPMNLTPGFSTRAPANNQHFN